MKAKLLLMFLSLSLLAGCNNSPYAYKNYCQKDYWGDSQFNIFGRKNCVGDTGRWISENNGQDGYFCTNPRCSTPERVRCKDVCKCY